MRYRATTRIKPIPAQEASSSPLMSRSSTTMVAMWHSARMDSCTSDWATAVARTMVSRTLPRLTGEQPSVRWTTRRDVQGVPWYFYADRSGFVIATAGNAGQERTQEQ